MRRRKRAIQEAHREELKDIEEAWEHLECADPEGYTETAMADVLRARDDSMMAVWRGRDLRACENCGTKVEMRASQQYCSTKCRVAAHRAAAATP